MITDAAEIKKRAAIEKPLSEVKQEQMALFSSKLDGWLAGDGIIQKDRYEEVLFAIMNVPELMANHLTFRDACILRGNQIKERITTDPEKTNILKLWEDFLKVLGDREDYMDRPPPLIVIRD